MAICGDDPNSWFWKLPMALLSIRTTLKPDIGASPAELVYGEGLAVPGDLLPDFPNNPTDLNNQRQSTLAGLRLEVERLQPTQTSAHRIPDVHIPDELKNATHVMVRRGGVHPPLTQPFVGPYRVDSHTQTGVKIHLPGRGTDEIALARVKPAHAENADPDQTVDDLENEVPPSPPPPGRRPGPQTRQPEPTSRVTRQHSRIDVQNPDPLSFDPGEGTSAQARAQSSPVESDSEDEHLRRLKRLRTPAPASGSESPPTDDPATPASPGPPSDNSDPFDGHVPAAKKLSPCPCDEPSAPCNAKPPRFFTKQSERKFSKQKVPDVQQPEEPTNPTPRPKTLFFSKPKPSNFSYRKRPDVNAFFNLVHDHLNS